jgi:hypothetical protein
MGELYILLIVREKKESTIIYISESQYQLTS